MKIKDMEDCMTTLKRIILFYNTERPHMSIGNQTPETVHQQFGPQKRCLRNTWDKLVAASAQG